MLTFGATITYASKRGLTLPFWWYKANAKLRAQCKSKKNKNNYFII